MPIANVQRVGSNGTGTVAGTTLAVAVPAGGCALGNKLLVAFSSNSNGLDALPTVTDSKGNTYSQILDYFQSTSGNKRLTCFECNITTPLVNGDTITITSPSLNKRIAQIREVSGLGPSVDRVQVTDSNTLFASQTSGPTSTATAARQSANEYVWGVSHWHFTATGDVFTGGAGYLDAWTTEFGDGGTIFRYIGSEYEIFAVSGTDAANGTLPGNRSWIMAALTFPIANAAGGAIAREAHVSEITDVATI